ncbi:MAG: acetyl/propionyl/methylcrotonyl-CoA carboxylase subunit alpha, partial [Kiloniellales bacterium]
MFETLLIANRGEIACRVIRTARRLGVRTVAVYSEADRGALHVELADEAHPIGPAPARDSYLDIVAVIRAARRAGAEAIHPGYGFLAENPEFAEACANAGMAFVGPPAAAIRAMGSKIEAKRVMERAGVPMLPGSDGEDEGDRRLAEVAAEIGYPVFIKASAGGGGKGMRKVAAAEDLKAALAAARREAKSSFGDDRLLIEKALIRPRHIEVQVFCDGHGGAVHLFERECSVQRRHQKVIEEAPAPGMTVRRRERMGSAAIAAARAIGYVGAGTVEFLVDRRGRFYFIEMNTRLQVEHPVTEMVTGVDLVEWQLLIAAGEKLPRRQEELSIDGHAIEARVYAEDPAHDFLPMAGRLELLRWPPEGRHVRVDTGVREGDEVSVHYDPMIAKLIAWDTDRRAALNRLGAALGETRIVGPATNLGLLSDIVAHSAFAEGRVDTGFIERHQADLVPAAGPAP